MKRPGERLRVLASRVCQPHAMERVIDPVIADLQCEYAAAQMHRQVWRGRWIRLAGYVAFWKVLGVHTAVRAVPITREWLAADDRAIGRTLLFSLLTTGIVTIVLVLPVLFVTGQIAKDGVAYLPGFTVDHLPRLILYLIPQALPVAIPVGFATGILCGLRGRAATARTRRSIIALAVAGSALLLVVLAWVSPAANQSYRDLVTSRRAARGLNELTMNELGSRGARFEYHQRWAWSGATMVLALFAYALSSVTRGKARAIPIGITISMAYAASYFMFGITVLWRWLPPFAGAWMPNVVVALVAIILFLRNSDPAAAGHRRGSSSRSG